METTANRIIWIFRNNKQEGPFHIEEIKKMIADRVLNKETLVWKEGMKSWVSLNTLLPNIPPPIPPQISAPSVFMSQPMLLTQKINSTGIGRLAFFLLNLIPLFTIGIAIVISATGDILLSIIFNLFSIITTIVLNIITGVLRLKNIGNNPILCLLTCVPIVNGFFAIYLLIAPPGYAYTKKLDTPGKIIVWSGLGFFGIMIFAIIIGSI
jgi:hypothetical protein